MAPPPTITREERDRGLARAHEANQARKEALSLLKDGVLSIGDVLDGQVEALAKMKVRSLLLKLPRIRNGDKVAIHLMGVGKSLTGHVIGVASAIADRELASSDNMLANVNPTFSWVRLAQRIPVRIAIDEVPAGVRLSAGQTATVTVLPAARVAERESPARL